MNVEFYDCGGSAGVFYGLGCAETGSRLCPNTSDGASEKHLPVVETDGDTVTVKAGSVEHPSTPEHFIGMLALETDTGLHAVEIKPGAKPVACFTVCGEKPLAAYACCNLHGVWKTEL